MKFTAVAVAAVALSLAGASVAATPASDSAYLAASRCKGLATGLGSSTTANLDAFLKAESRTRNGYILEHGADLMSKAKREASNPDAKPRLTNELNSQCHAYLGDKATSAGS